MLFWFHISIVKIAGAMFLKWMHWFFFLFSLSELQEVAKHSLEVAIEELLNVEKQMRVAGDVAGTKKAAIEILKPCFEAQAWSTLNDQIMLIVKRRGQLKQVCGLIFVNQPRQLIVSVFELSELICWVQTLEYFDGE